MKQKIIRGEKKEVDTITKLQRENEKLKLKISQLTQKQFTLEKKQLALERRNFNLERKLAASQREYREFREKNKLETHEERLTRLRDGTANEEE